MTTLLIAGATGLVGRATLELALADARVASVVAPTRRALAPHPRLHNPLLQDLGAFDEQAAWWRVDNVVCALGTTMREAGSRDQFKRVDFEYPMRIARSAYRHGAGSFVLTSASGASVRSPFFYSRTKGELERTLASVGYASLTFVRPGLLLGHRQQPRPGETRAAQLLGAVAPLLPARYRPVPAEAVAKALLDAAIAAKPGVHVIESEYIATEPPNR